MTDITAHMLVKNEDLWVFYSISSVLPYVSKLLITDTGSTDHTLEIIDSFSSPKIDLYSTKTTSATEITNIRQQQLNQTKTDWFWIVDADEIYPKNTVTEILSALDSDSYEGIVVRRHDLLGDIYHKQDEMVGSYELFGQKGHLLNRLINKRKIPGLQVKGDYPLEGYYDATNTSIRDRDKSKYYITSSYLYHAAYLKRSSGSDLSKTLNRNKYKYEKGIVINKPTPEIFKKQDPLMLSNPLAKRNLKYEIISSIITPLKKFKRKILWK